MHKYDISNRNGSVVFVNGIRVKPYANFSADLDPLTARELTRYGVLVTKKTLPALPTSPPPSSTLVTLAAEEERVSPEPVFAEAEAEAEEVEEAIVSAVAEEHNPSDSMNLEEPALLQEEDSLVEESSGDLEVFQDESSEEKTLEIEETTAETSISSDPPTEDGRRRKKNRR